MPENTDTIFEHLLLKIFRTSKRGCKKQDWKRKSDNYVKNSQKSVATPIWAERIHFI